ncbi:amino acid-binding protein [Vulcanisaeta souniana]|uniref:ACT domain-containing protein n=1 Tax=Vulcanisaeta souniana JCM 11219 TaxID=1293586 RepID=A0A830EHF8_9CREN|nr:amino acid-binding protein [Vulcanisaeta souniana]BDR93415.1 hypothetical protein Vsou_25080 [Vulcanisaeta souniana JCM 11219]GGI76935.1 hypothetical protein GCM10007112_12190 [Vulcanisaeta souniana JCM 11219]
MVWLLVSISRDRPGLLNDITGIIRSHNMNIRNIVGNNYAILIEVEGKADTRLMNELGNVDGVNTVNSTELPITLLGFVKEDFMKAVLYYVMERDPELLERLGYEYGKELMRHLLDSVVDARDAIYTSLRILTALGVLVLVDMRFAQGGITVSITEAFDEDVGMPMTRGIIKGLFETTGARHSIKIERRDTQSIITVT